MFILLTKKAVYNIIKSGILLLIRKKEFEILGADKKCLVI